MIYTSYFANLKKLPKDMTPVAICGKSPDWYKGLEYKKLAPRWWFFKEWKDGIIDNNGYIKNFYKEVLSDLDPTEVVNYILELTQGKTPVLICYEKPGDFCHRHLVADWLNKAGIKCTEYIK